jgi:glycosyltransferase involved in cell wall biosynthesis
MKDRPRILLISYLPPTKGGIATWAGILRDQQPNGKHSFRFIEVSGKGNSGYLRWPIKALHSVLLVARVIYELFRNDPDVVHLNCCLSALGVWRDLAVAGLVCACRIPLIVHYHGSVPDVFERFIAPSRLGLQWLIKFATVNIGITRGSVAFLAAQSGGWKTQHLPNFIEDERLHRSATNMTGERESPSGSRPQAIYAGKLSRGKGIIDLLGVADALPNVDFLLIGEILEEIRPAVERAPSNVTAIGALPRSQVIERLFLSDLFVFPSLRAVEGFPNAVLEAMAAGLPVVSTRVGCVAEMIEEGRGGRLTAPADVGALTEAIRELACDRGLGRRMGEYNRQVCLRKFRFSTVFQELSAIYDLLATQKTVGKGSATNFRPPRERYPTSRSSKTQKADS